MDGSGYRSPEMKGGRGGRWEGRQGACNTLEEGMERGCNPAKEKLLWGPAASALLKMCEHVQRASAGAAMCTPCFSCIL